MDAAWLVAARCRWFIVSMGPGLRRDDEIWGGVHQRLIIYVIPQATFVIPAKAGIHKR